MSTEEAKLPGYSLPKVTYTSAGWGPAVESTTDRFQAIPFAPFSSRDRIGRISDWASNKGSYRGRGGGQEGAFTYKQAEDEKSFAIVETTKIRHRPKVKRYQPTRYRRRRPQYIHSIQKRRQRYFQNRRYGYNKYANAQSRLSSIKLDDSWEQVGKLDLDKLANARTTEPESKTLVTAGTLHEYKTSYDRLDPKAPRRLNLVQVEHITGTTSDDPVLKELMRKKVGSVYATDTILAVLMASPKAVLSWDIVVSKKDGVLRLEKRPASRMDILSVNQNWNEVLEKDKSDINHPDNLGEEATFINQNFCQQVLNTESKGVQLERPDPFADLVAGQPAHCGYLYRSVKLGNADVVFRATAHGYVRRGDEQQYIRAFALNEFDPKHQGGEPYRQALRQQAGAVLATEAKNNAFKIRRWVGHAVLADCAEIRLGFVARNDPSNQQRHQILKVHRQATHLWAKTMHVRVRNLWGVLETVVSFLSKQDDGEYVLLKEPNKKMLALYRVPNGVDPMEM